MPESQKPTRIKTSKHCSCVVEQKQELRRTISTTTAPEAPVLNRSLQKPPLPPSEAPSEPIGVKISRSCLHPMWHYMTHSNELSNPT